jgi:hypothetical protein
VNEAIFILNGVNVTAQTQGLQSLRERIYYDDELRGYLREIGGEITLEGDAFRFVQQRFQNNFDNPIPCNLSVLNPHTEIIESVFNGVIFPADCEFDLYAKQVTCQLVDTTFFAKIDNNKNLKFTLNAGQSKLGVDITNRGGEVDYQNITALWTTAPIFTGGTGATGRQTRAVTLFQALDYLVAAMTDGEVEFFSTALTDVIDTPNYVIMSGEQVRMEDPLIARRPYVSWAELFGDLSRQFNLLMAVEEFQPNRFRIRVEPFDFWKQQQITDLFEVKPRVKERIDTAMLPASVLVGSAKVEKKLPIPSADLVNKDPTISALLWTPPVSTFYFDWLPQSPFIYHWQEEYNYQYQSNVDTPQVLRHSVCITDSKLYQYQVSQYWARFVVSGFDTEGDVDTSYDEDVFLIHSINKPLTTVYRPIAYLEPFFTIINRDINNVNTMQRNLSNVPASASLLYSSVGAQSFRAYYTNAITVPTISRLDSTNSNPKTLYLVLGTTGGGGEFIGNTTYFGASGAASVLGFVGASNVAPSPPNTNMRVVTGYNDITAPGFDNSGSYNTTAFSWTVNLTAIYSFRIFLEFFATKLGGATFCHWDSGGNLIHAIRLGTVQAFGINWMGANGGSTNQYNSFTQVLGAYYAQPGDVFQVILENVTQTNPSDTVAGDLYLSEDSFWEIAASSLPGTGGTILNTGTGSSFLVENELEADIPLNVWNQIKANPFAKFYYQVADDGEGRTAFLKDFDREIISGRFNGITSPERPTPLETNTIQSLPEVEPDEEE